MSFKWTVEINGKLLASAPAGVNRKRRENKPALENQGGESSWQSAGKPASLIQVTPRTLMLSWGIQSWASISTLDLRTWEGKGRRKYTEWELGGGSVTAEHRIESLSHEPEC